MNAPKEQQRTCLWYGLDLVITSGAREAVEYALMEAGALGTENEEGALGLFRVTAYFDNVPERERVRRELQEALRIYSLPSSSVRDMSVREVADEDWLGEWKKSWQPVEVGERFIIAPPWSEVRDVLDRVVIRIEPGMAFGTGTHETTRLCLAAIEKHFDGGSFLDVGTGTGILAIAAAKLFPESRVEACDTDAEAIAIAKENAQLNGVPYLAFRVGRVEEGRTASADCVCANLTADTITQILPTLIGATCGRLILSGILDSQGDTVLTRLQELGVSEAPEVTSEGEWICIVV
ncbi:MAG: 50S ribosomal protein L11 methyltransferase [Pyrinomonadaceae bacterium]|nr:50S ribosomal protein L11 methyltransferase [Pyrinomonadaceae bacterium]